jgi:ribosome-associated translation inhibitor RaiA
MDELQKKALVEFKARMRRVAEKNNDEFKVTMTLDEKGHHIEVVETADGHTFLTSTGADVFAAIEAALKELPGALESWGYTNAN